MSDLYYQSTIDQLNKTPICHVKRIRVRKTLYTGHAVGTHFAIEFLSKDGYLLGKFENQDEVRVVDRIWRRLNNWRQDIQQDEVIATLDSHEHIVGIKLGIAKIQERDYVESFQFIIANCKKDN